MTSAGLITKNSKGFLTIEFSVALLISVAFSVMFFCIAFTLSTAFVAQYIAFSLGRIYSGGHVDEGAQKTLAEIKCKKIMTAPGIGRLFSQGWFTLPCSSLEFRSGQRSAGENVFSEYKSASEDGTRLAATGVRLLFGTKLLNLKLGPLGSTNPNDEPMTAKVTGFMLRNPTQDECQKFFNVERYKAIIKIDDRFNIYDKQFGGSSKYFAMEDNGC